MASTVPPICASLLPALTSLSATYSSVTGLTIILAHIFINKLSCPLSQLTTLVVKPLNNPAQSALSTIFLSLAEFLCISAAKKAAALEKAQEEALTSTRQETTDDEVGVSLSRLIMLPDLSWSCSFVGKRVVQEN